MSATSTYLTIVNNSITESGADLATFKSDGSDFTSNTNSLMQRMRTYVARAWKDIQMTAYDWDFMAEQAVVNLDPGIMFYTDGTSVSTFSSALGNGQTFNIYDEDGTVALSNLSAGNFVDLTATATLTAPFGYFNFLNVNYSTPLNIALKPGAEYFRCDKSVTFDNLVSYSIGGSGFLGLVNNVSNFTSLLDSSHPYYVNFIGNGVTYKLGLYNVSSTGIGFYYNSADAGAFLAMFATLDTPATLTDVATGQTVVSWTGLDGSAAGSLLPGNTVTVTNGAIAYVHSWKSFNFSEETQVDDFQENIQEINQQSFRIIDYYKNPPSGEGKLVFVPWPVFEEQYDLSNAYPGFPRIISKDNTGRWRLYPAPYYRVVVKFDYVRKPQILSAYNDLPRGIEEEFVDTIMWKALMYYGSYDEQPSVYARAEKFYKDYMFRLELRNREKFHFKPIRLY